MSEEFRAELIDWLESELKSVEPHASGHEWLSGYFGAITNALDFVQGAEVYLDYLYSKEQETKNSYAKEYFETYDKAHAQYLNSLEEEEAK